MTKAEMITLLEQIESFFPGRFTADEKTASVWWEILKDYDFEHCRRNLIKHVQTSEFPPTIANLIAGSKDISRNYSDDLIEKIENVPEIEEIVAEIERRTGRKVMW